MVGSLLRPHAFSARYLSFAYPSPLPRCQVLFAFNEDSDTDVARICGRLLRDLRAQLLLAATAGYFPDSDVRHVPLRAARLRELLPH
jgi:hypothetical protein